MHMNVYNTCTPAVQSAVYVCKYEVCYNIHDRDVDSLQCDLDEQLAGFIFVIARLRHVIFSFHLT